MFDKKKSCYLAFNLIVGIYGPCRNTGPSPAPENNNATMGHVWRRPMTPQLERYRAVGGPDACFDQIAAYTWLNDPVTKSQLHVSPDLTWILCSNNITYTSTQSDESKVIYPTLVEKANLKVLIYNGEPPLWRLRLRRFFLFVIRACLLFWHGCVL
jgi:hypothetical protein